jgi:hypothetical protein
MMFTLDDWLKRLYPLIIAAHFSSYGVLARLFVWLAANGHRRLIHLLPYQ